MDKVVPISPKISSAGYINTYPSLQRKGGVLWVHLDQAELRVEVTPEEVEVPHVGGLVVHLV